MTRLYELTAAYRDLQERLDAPDADDAQLAVWLEACEGALQEKATNIAMLVRNLESTAEAISAAEKRMAERRKALEGRADRIRAWVLGQMVTSGIRKIECPLFTLAVRANPPSVVIHDENDVPIQYWRQPEPPPPKPDRKLILADIKQGCVIEGCSVEQTQRLDIR